MDIAIVNKRGKKFAVAAVFHEILKDAKSCNSLILQIQEKLKLQILLAAKAPDGTYSWANKEGRIIPEDVMDIINHLNLDDINDPDVGWIDVNIP